MHNQRFINVFSQSSIDDVFKILIFSDRTIFIISFKAYQMYQEMSGAGKKKTEKAFVRLPDLKPNIEEQYRQKDLTDPPLLKKGNLKPISNNAEKSSDHLAKLVDIFQKTQTQFSHIYKQIISLTQRQDSFNTLILQHIGLDAKKRFRSSGAAPEDLQARYRYFFIEPPQDGGSKTDIEKIKKWLGRVFTQTFSVAFHRFSKGDMNFDQTKIFCSSNILRNLVNITQKLQISVSTLQVMEQEMAKLLRYLQLKYPLTESTEINKALDGAIQQVDNMGLLAHNYFATSQIVFQWRDSGNYNDLIMRMLNDILSKIDERSPLQKTSNFVDFKKIMTGVFESVEEQQEVQSVQQDFIPGILDFITDRYVRAKSALRQHSPPNDKYMKASSKIRQEKEKYRSKIKQYTHYAIGRKIPESYQPYTNKEIQSMNMTIKSPAVLRILTKWAAQLWNKFKTPEYYAALSDGIKSQKGGTVHSLLFPLRRILDEQMSKQQLQIQKFLKNSARDSLDMQLKLLRKQLKRGAVPLGDLQFQQICGRYSIQILNSLHSYLISYINRLIHGLTSVARRFYERSNVASAGDWSSPPDLVTFTLGDLLRCKISSRQKEILRVYDQLKQMSIKNPQKLKIIRVKNRLNKSTNDILVNIRFNNLITAEIQLAVKVQMSEFIKSSNIFCHFLYELERSPFGAIAELCNVWAALDRTSESFKQILDAQAARQTPIRSHKCPVKQSIPFERPFICHTCEVVYYHNNFLRSHVQCQQCKQVICAKCLLRDEDPQELKASLISNKALRSDCREMIQRLDTSSNLSDRDLPQFGVCISIERREATIQIFRYICHGNQRFILGRSGGDIYEVEKVQNLKQLASFLRQYLIFRLDPVSAQNHISLSHEEAIAKFILPRVLKSAYKRERETLVIGQNMGNQVLQNALKSGNPQGKDKIRKMFLDSNKIKTVDFIAAEFKNLVLLELSFNPIQNLEGLNQLFYLKSLALTGCQLRSLPSSLFLLKSLEELRLSVNRLISIEGIGNLQRLKLLDLSNNNIQQLPQQIGLCIDLIILRSQNNILIELPKQLANMKQLRGLYISKNALKMLPEEIGLLSALQQLQISQNRLQTLPEDFGKLFNLQKLDLSSNILNNIPQSFQDLQSMRQLNLSKNTTLSVLPHSFSQLTQLTYLDISRCAFVELPKEVSQLSSLRQLKIANNKLSGLLSIQKLSNIQIIDASYNIIQSNYVQDSFANLSKLESIKLNNNNLTTVPNFLYCQKLSKMDLSYNHIAEVKQNQIAGLQTLQFLKLDHNRIQRVPQGLMMLPKLREINLANNKLKNLGGESKTVWPSLLKIDLSQNELIQVPHCLLYSQKVGQASHVASIDISSNKIEQLPQDLTKLKNLKTFKCNRNNLKHVTVQLERFMKEKKIDIEIKEVKSPQEISPYRKGFSRSKGRKI